MINIDDFKKIELKVAKVISAEKVENSEKLLKLEVDLGYEKRQIVSGIAKSYSSDDLIGKQIIIVANLEPRSLMGLESQGMVLAANSESGPVLLVPEKEVASGIKIS
jgi:methionine--tRNA ligase beta chain